MLEKYKAMMDGAKAAVEAADEIHASAESVVASLKMQRQTMEAHRGDVVRYANERADQIVRDANVTAGMIDKMQSDIDAMIAQIEGPAEKPAVEQFAEATS